MFENLIPAETRLRLKLVNVTNVLIGANVVLFVIQNLLIFFIPTSAVLFLMGAENLPAILAGEVWRPLTAMFLHANILHIFFNMYALWFLGNSIEANFGGKKLFFLYVVGGLFGSVFSLLSVILPSIASGVATQSYISVGASGAIFAFMGLLLGQAVRSRRFGWQPEVNLNSLLLIIGYNLLFGFVVPGVNNAAHIGGLFAGFVLSFVLVPSLTFPKNKFIEKLIEVLFYVLLVAVIVAFVLQGLSTMSVLF